uniref:Uncharacterized protein n=1 Tax=Arundo donax TaxID=35708 RepID=A0A0A8Z3H5_ARUDO
MELYRRYEGPYSGLSLRKISHFPQSSGKRRNSFQRDGQR